MEASERFTVEITERGMDITGKEGEKLRLSPLDALMLLDILRNEEANLRKAADEASPLPVSIHP